MVRSPASSCRSNAPVPRPGSLTLAQGVGTAALGRRHAAASGLGRGAGRSLRAASLASQALAGVLAAPDFGLTPLRFGSRDGPPACGQLVRTPPQQASSPLDRLVAGIRESLDLEHPFTAGEL